MIRILVAAALCLAAAGCATPHDARLQQYRAGLIDEAERGDAAAQYQLGMSYCCGYDPARNRVTARRWLCRSAVQDYAPAQYQLGRYYEAHTYFWRPFKATAQQIIQAYVWYTLAADHGDEQAQQYASTLGTFMSPLMRAEADTLRGDWREKLCGDVPPVEAAGSSSG